MVIVECKMPDLLDFQESKFKVISHFLICQLGGVGTDFPEKLSSYRANIARLIDKAIYEYNQSREYALLENDEPKRSVEDMTENGRYIYVHFIANHLENCIITVRRLIRYFDRVKSGKGSPVLDKLLKKQIESLSKDITNTRDLIEHMDQDIHDGKKKRDDMIMPILNADASEIILLATRLKTASLAMVIRKLHQFAYDFMEYRINDQGEYFKI